MNKQKDPLPVHPYSHILTLNLLKISPSRHARISDASLRRLIQRLRVISKRVDLQISLRRIPED